MFQKLGLILTMLHLMRCSASSATIVLHFYIGLLRDNEMGCGFSTESGRRAFKNCRLDTHDIFIERYPAGSRGDHAYRLRQAGQSEIERKRSDPLRQIDRPEKGRLALVVRRKDAVDDMHERGELGRRWYRDDDRWDPYAMTRNGIQMRGGRLWRLDDAEHEAARNHTPAPAPPPVHVHRIPPPPGLGMWPPGMGPQGMRPPPGVNQRGTAPSENGGDDDSESGGEGNAVDGTRA